MEYEIKHTFGIILKKTEKSDDSFFFTILTQENTIVLIEGVSIRKLSSKLRFHMEVGDSGEYSFVLGRKIKRLLFAQRLEKIEITKESVFEKAVMLIMRFSQYDQMIEDLYTQMHDLFFLEQEEQQNISYDSKKEEVFVFARILDLFGYADSNMQKIRRIQIYEMPQFQLDGLREKIRQAIAEAQL
jgi:hypothetical protein